MLHRISTALAVAVVAIVAIAAAPQAFARKLGPEFQVTATGFSGKVAGFQNGAFVVVWRGSGGNIFAQRYHPNGTPNGGEFQVNTTEGGSPNVAALSNGGFVVIWGGGPAIFGQRFGSDGTPAGEQFRVDTPQSSHLGHVAVAGLSGGGFVVVWDSFDEDVFGAVFNSAGVHVRQEFLVNAYTVNRQRRPSVAALGNGGFVVVWDSLGQDGDGLGVYGRRFTANGTPLGNGQFRVNPIAQGGQCCASVAGLGADRFVVVWYIGGNLHGRRFNRNGPLGDEFRVNTSDAPIFISAFRPSTAASVAGLNDGRFVVVWSADLEFNGTYGIYGQRFDAAGNKLRGEFHVNTSTDGDQTGPSVAGFPAFSNGRFVVVWQPPGVSGQRFAD